MGLINFSPIIRGKVVISYWPLDVPLGNFHGVFPVMSGESIGQLLTTVSKLEAWSCTIWALGPHSN